MQRSREKIVDLKQLFTVDQILVVFTLILVAFCQLHINFV